MYSEEKREDGLLYIASALEKTVLNVHWKARMAVSWPSLVLHEASIQQVRGIDGENEIEIHQAYLKELRSLGPSIVRPRSM
jgi:hypothetical protein